MKKDYTYSGVRFVANSPAISLGMEENVIYYFVNGTYLNGVFISVHGDYSKHLEAASKALNKLTVIENALNLGIMRPRGLAFWTEGDLNKFLITDGATYTLLSNLTKAVRFNRSSFSEEGERLSMGCSYYENLVEKASAGDLVFDMKEFGETVFFNNVRPLEFRDFKNKNLMLFAYSVKRMASLMKDFPDGCEFTKLPEVKNFQSQIEVKNFLVSCLKFLNELIDHRQILGEIFVQECQRHVSKVQNTADAIRQAVNAPLNLDHSV